MNIDDVQIDHYYRTRSGTLCKVTAIEGDDEKQVSFIPYSVEHQPGEADAMPAIFFAANIEEEVDLVDPQGKPMEDATAATPV